MSWTTAKDLRAQVQRLWERGELLRASVSENYSWPRRLMLKTPVTADLSDRFEAIRQWAHEVAKTPHIRIESRERIDRVQGRQELPDTAWMDSLQEALAFIGQKEAAQRYRALWQQTESTEPTLLAWLNKRPLQALELGDRWERLLSVIKWLQAHPRPRIYLRQVDVPGVDSKFIENHRGVLTELLDLALPSEAIDATATGVTQFARRYGFLDKPARIRFRLLDPTLLSLPGVQSSPDITLDAASFALLSLPAAQVFITENEINFLTFPATANAIVIFGSGYGWEALAEVAWLHERDVRYWGDIDTDGFHILDQLRNYFPHVLSFLMDRETLLAHRLHWGEDLKRTCHDLTRLTVEEASLYDELRFDRIQRHLGLEQERIGYGWLSDRLKASVPAHNIKKTVK